MFKGGKAQLRWPAREIALSPAETKLLLNMVLIGRDAAQRGGEVRVEIARGSNGTEISVESHGPLVTLQPEVSAVLQASEPVLPNEPRLVVATLARELARGMGQTLDCDFGSGRMALRVGAKG